ncbi:hypothetical protein Hanom_Chr00s008961g01742011 [Helianthus anomalus]
MRTPLYHHIVALFFFPFGPRFSFYGCVWFCSFAPPLLPVVARFVYQGRSRVHLGASQRLETTQNLLCCDSGSSRIDLGLMRGVGLIGS